MSLIGSVKNRLVSGYQSAAGNSNHFGALSDIGQFAKGVVSPGKSSSANFKYSPLPTVDNSAINPPAPGPSSYGSGSVGGGVVGPNLNALRNNIYGDQNQINALYSQLDGAINTYGADKRGQIDSNYADQFGANDKAYAGANNTTNTGFESRGLSDSSLRANALGDNFGAYQTSNKSLTNAQNNDLASLGSTLNAAKQDIGNKPQYDLSQYNDADSLSSLHQQLGEHIQNLRSASQKYLTNGQLQNSLNQIAPAKSQLADQLKSRLDTLLQGNADSAAKQGIANTYIAALPADQQDPYKQYLAQQLAQAK